MATTIPKDAGTVESAQVRKHFMEMVNRYHNVNQSVLEIIGNSLLNVRWRIEHSPHEFHKRFQVSVQCRAPDGNLAVDIVQCLILQDTLGEQQSYALEKCMHDAVSSVAASDVHIPKLCLVWADYILEAEKTTDSFRPEIWSKKIADEYWKSLHGK